MSTDTTKTVIDLLTDSLKAGGYDGLVAEDRECGCELGDLVRCDQCFDTCEPAYRGPNPSGETEWLMYSTKKAASEATPPGSRQGCEE